METLRERMEDGGDEVSIHIYIYIKEGEGGRNKCMYVLSKVVRRWWLW